MTTLDLSEKDQALLSGELGPAARVAMSILVRMARVYRAKEMIDITRAHIDATIYVGDAGLEFAEKLASLGGRVAVPSTLNVSGLDENHWKEWSVPADWAEKAHRQMLAYQKMGTIPIWTCAPYQTEHAPKLGEQIAWGESNAIAFANSVLGARTERYPDYLDVCAALTGRVPAVGLHLEENRGGEIVLDLGGIPEALAARDDFYPVLGHYAGKVAGERIPVLANLEVRPSEDQLKALGAAASSSGSVALFHVVGVTPEAPTLDEALRGRAPAETVAVTVDDLRGARNELSTAVGDSLDLVVLGSPHFSFEEFRRLAPLLEGKKRHESVTFLVTTSRVTRELAEKAGLLRALQDFGGRVTVDTCILATPMLPPSVHTLMTNSGKYALYSPGLLNVDVAFGSLEDCVSSAVAGRITRAGSPWEDLPYLALALSPAVEAAAQLDAFRYDAKRVPVGRMYQYLKSNRDGSHSGNVTLYVAATDRLEALKWEEGHGVSAYVIAIMDWARFSVRRFESWQLPKGGAPVLRATLDVDGDGNARASFLPDQLIRLGNWPWHSYDFDFASLGITLPHLTRPEAEFSFYRTDILQEEGRVDFREVGAVRVRFEAIENHGGVETRRYRLTGPGVLDTEGMLWVDRKDGHIVEFELPIPDEPGLVDGRLRLLEVTSMTPDEWDAFKKSRVEG